MRLGDLFRVVLTCALVARGRLTRRLFGGAPSPRSGRLRDRKPGLHKPTGDQKFVCPQPYFLPGISGLQGANFRSPCRIRKVTAHARHRDGPGPRRPLRGRCDLRVTSREPRRTACAHSRARAPPCSLPPFPRDQKSDHIRTGNRRRTKAFRRTFRWLPCGF